MEEDLFDANLPEVPAGYTSSWAQYTVQLPVGANRNALQAHLAEAGIPTMVYYPKPMHEQKAFKDKCLVAPDGCLVAERLCETVLSLPMSPCMADRELSAVVHAVKEFYD